MPTETPAMWTCHICGEERPDSSISVHQRRETDPRFPGAKTQTVRYCNDQPLCTFGATVLRFAGFKVSTT
jgi:hypothetical protein